jgi:mono/diheme cytochrome c family protein
MLLVLIAPAVSLRAAPVDYVTQVKPIFASRCVTCHGALKQKSGLRLDAGTLALKGGKHGAAVVPGKSADSVLVHAISGGTNGASKMPEEGDPLKAEQIALIRQWIDEGAKVPTDEAIPAGPESHWSFKPPIRPQVPTVKNAAWVKNPIDAFVAAGHEKHGLTPRPEAEKDVLLRRVTLDLTGLPPTPEELHAFLADQSSDAYENVVDRLLASLRYGERWGRHWMDVWRYSDWAGYAAEVRFSQPHIWRWRDWIVESLNADKPYDRMVREMLAADEIAGGDPRTVRATGFLVRSWFKFNRNTWMEDVVEHTGKAFLGLTLNCAKCHDHMYDPVSQKEYYSFRAIFEPYDIRTDPVPGGTLDTKAAGLVRVADLGAERPTYLFVRGDERNPKKDAPMPPGVPAALGGTFEVAKVDLPPAAYYPGLAPHVREAYRAVAKGSVATAEQELKTSEAALTQAQATFTKLASAVDAKSQAATTQPASQAVVSDNFSAARPDLWQVGPGQWAYKDGKLVQSEPNAPFKYIRSVATHAPDLSARVTFAITGGTQYRSVGLSFDVTDAEDAQCVYLSANATGPVLTTLRLDKGKPVYDGPKALPLPVKLKETYELRVDVLGELVNVYVNDVVALAYKVRTPRRPGRIAIWTYDGTAEFTAARVEPLPAGVKVAEKVDAAPTTIPPLDPKARLVNASNALRVAGDNANLARLKLNASTAEAAALEAKIAADDAKYAAAATTRPADAESLALAAGRAERAVNLAKAGLNAQTAANAMLAAQLALKGTDAAPLKTLADAGIKSVAAKNALDAARAGLDKPSPQYAPIGMTYPASSTGRRAALAKWIMSRDNPLAARVAVNHIWMRHFGAPIVPTVFDFGLNGKPPTNPALLDWLAVELMEPSTGSGQDHGWSMKHVHRLLVTSAAYRMRSDVGTGPSTETNSKLDPDNVYLWRSNTRRMEAEVVRDSVLSVAGSLDATFGGPDIPHEQGLTSNRRSLYFQTAPEKQMTFLATFDAASNTECYRRNESVMPQQALALSNSTLAVAQSRKLASLLTNQAGIRENAPTAFVAAAFERILSRAPTPQEQATCEQFLLEQASRLTKPSELSPFAAGEKNAVPPSWDPVQRARENLVHVLLNHNDFVTIR